MEKSLFTWTSAYDEHLMLMDEMGREVTYKEAQHFATTHMAGLKRGALILILTQNTIGSVLTYIGALREGLIPILMDRKISGEALDDMIRRYSPEYVAVPADADKLTKYVAVPADDADLPAERTAGLVLSDYKIKWQDEGYRLHERTLADCEGLIEPCEKLAKPHEGLGLLLSTSGSTGSPKLVRQSRENIDANARAICEYLGIRAEDRVITTLPMSYTYGLSMIHSHLLCGATILLTNRSLVEMEFWTFLKEAEATTFGGVPYTYELLQRLRFHRMQLPSLRYLTQAGGRLKPALQTYMNETMAAQGKQFIVMYGQTEATARMSYLPWSKATEKVGSMGIPIPGGRFELVDETGQVIAKSNMDIKTGTVCAKPNTIGELIYYGPNVTWGYAETRADLSLGDERGGRLETGDLAYADEDGFYFIAGRKKRFIKILGNRISLDETESILSSAFATGVFACVGEDDHMRIFYEEEAVSEEAVRDYLAKKLKLFPSVFEVKKALQLPRKASGKIDYEQLKRGLTG